MVQQGHELAQRKNLDLRELSKHPAILPGLNTYTGQIVKSLFDRRSLKMQIAIATNYLETIRMMASVGLGWTVLPRSMLRYVFGDTADSRCAPGANAWGSPSRKPQPVARRQGIYRCAGILRGYESGLALPLLEHAVAPAPVFPHAVVVGKIKGAAEPRHDAGAVIDPATAETEAPFHADLLHIRLYPLTQASRGDVIDTEVYRGAARDNTARQIGAGGRRNIRQCHQHAAVANTHGVTVLRLNHQTKTSTLSL